MQLGTIINIYRRQKHLSIRTLAKEIGIHYTALFRFENGGNVDAHTYIAILNWINRNKVMDVQKETEAQMRWEIEKKI